MARCAAIKPNGERCKVEAIDHAKWCWSHHPDYEEQRRRRASKGGKRGGRGRPGVEVSDVKARLAKLAEDILAGDVKRADAAVVSQIWNIYLRAISVEARLDEERSLAQEIAEIHDALRARKESRWGFGNNSNA